jgi:hypothetical protein
MMVMREDVTLLLDCEASMRIVKFYLSHTVNLVPNANFYSFKQISTVPLTFIMRWLRTHNLNDKVINSEQEQVRSGLALTQWCD